MIPDQINELFEHFVPTRFHLPSDGGSMTVHDIAQFVKKSMEQALGDLATETVVSHVDSLAQERTVFQNGNHLFGFQRNPGIFFDPQQGRQELPVRQDRFLGELDRNGEHATQKIVAPLVLLDDLVGQDNHHVVRSERILFQVDAHPRSSPEANRHHSHFEPARIIEHRQVAGIFKNGEIVLDRCDKIDFGLQYRHIDFLYTLFFHTAPSFIFCKIIIIFRTPVRKRLSEQLFGENELFKPGRLSTFAKCFIRIFFTDRHIMQPTRLQTPYYRIRSGVKKG